MAEYIEREAAIAEILKGTIATSNLYGMGVASGMDIALDRVKSVPTADVAPVRHGRWKLNKDGSGTCNACNMTQKSVSKTKTICRTFNKSRNVSRNETCFSACGNNTKVG